MAYKLNNKTLRVGQAGWFATDPSGGTLEFSAEL